MVSANLYGPFREGVEPAERRCQLHALLAIAHLQLGPQHPLVADLRAADSSPEALAKAHSAVEALPSLRRRHLLATLCAVLWPSRRRGGEL
jgi:hypothetical protein